MTNHLATVLCLQVADDYDYLMNKVGVKSKRLTPKTYMKELNRANCVEDKHMQKLRRSILRNYEINLKSLENSNGN